MRSRQLAGNVAANMLARSLQTRRSEWVSELSYSYRLVQQLLCKSLKMEWPRLPKDWASVAYIKLSLAQRSYSSRAKKTSRPPSFPVVLRPRRPKHRRSEAGWLFLENEWSVTLWSVTPCPCLAFQTECIDATDAPTMKVPKYPERFDFLFSKWTNVWSKCSKMNQPQKETS